MPVNGNHPRLSYSAQEWAVSGPSGVCAFLCQPAHLSIPGVPSGNDEESLEREGSSVGTSGVVSLTQYTNSASGLRFAAQETVTAGRKSA